MPTKNNALIINILSLRNSLYKKLCAANKLTKFELDVLLISSHFTSKNLTFEIAELQKHSGHDAKNLRQAMKKLEQSGLVERIGKSRQWYTAHTWTITGQGNALLRKLCSLYQKIEAL